jgi:hypothetical protein
LPIHPPLGNFQLISESYSPEKRLTAWRDDVEEDEVPPKSDEEGNPVNIEEGSRSETSNAPTLEDLMKKLEKLKVEQEAKGKRKENQSILLLK